MPKGKPLTDAEKAKRDKERGEKFRKLGGARINKAVKSIRALIPLSNRNQYSYSDAQIAIIRKELRDATEAVEQAFAGKEIATNEITL